MNKDRRKNLKKAVTLLNEAQEKVDQAKCIVEEVKDEEQESYDNLPEGVQDGERGDAMYENINDLDGAYDELDTIYDSIEEQVDAIQEVIDR